MTSNASTVEQYLETLPADRKEAVQTLYRTLRDNLPEGFEEMMSHGMPGWVVPHSLFPAGYHCNPSDPLPFIGFASQKNFIALYHMGIYANPELLDWFTSQWASRVKGKLDMGKSCIRFKKPEAIPFDLIGELAGKVTPQDWIETYQSVLEK